MATIDPQELAGRYVAVWNEPDAKLRREAIRGLWAEDGTHILQPPQQIQQAAATLGFPAATLQARGHAALEVRVSRACEQFAAPGAFTFTARGNAARLGEVVTFTWDMVPAAGGEAAGSGLEILLLGGDGRITADYQFIER
jgi:hypothetical protein